jgi:hypothetical protein
VRGPVKLAPHNPMGHLDILVMVFGLALIFTLTALLVLRNLVARYPWFFAYVVFSSLATIALLATNNHYQVFFRIFWATEAIYAVLALLALHEAFRDVFRTDYEDWPWFRLVFPAAVAVLAMFFIGNAVLHPPVQASRLVSVIISAEKVVSCVNGGLFLLSFFLALLLLGRSWPTFPYGVSLGFAVSALGTATAFWALSIFGTKFILLAKYGPPVAYIVGVVIWIASCFLPPEPERRWAGFSDPEQGLATVRQYLRALRWISGRR